LDNKRGGREGGDGAWSGRKGLGLCSLVERERCVQRMEVGVLCLTDKPIQHYYLGINEQIKLTAEGKSTGEKHNSEDKHLCFERFMYSSNT
jgi:hypothetical protein